VSPGDKPIGALGDFVDPALVETVIAEIKAAEGISEFCSFSSRF